MGIFDKIQDTTAAVTSSDKNTTSIGENCTIDGDITFDKTIEIHGKITGTVRIAENCTTAMLIIKKNGIVEGDVYGDEVVIEGEVIGNVTGKKKITIKSSSFVSGNVYYDILDMNGGATKKILKKSFCNINCYLELFCYNVPTVEITLWKTLQQQFKIKNHSSSQIVLQKKLKN